MKALRVLILFCTAIVACSKSPEPPAARGSAGTSVPANTGNAAPAAAPSTTGPGTVSGMLPPAAGGFPSIVILEPQDGSGLPAQPEVPYMDQIQQTFIPPVLMVRTGQPVEFRNSDDVMHNVRVREDATHAPAFNVAIPNGEKYVFTFQRDGFYDVGCDIHPGMAAQVVSSNSPYTAVADAEGNFAIENVPAGTYKAVVWAGAQKIEKPVTVAGQTTFNVGP
jgi:plastocyanin